MRLRIVLTSTLIALMLLSSGTLAQAADLAAAKDLYASAAYEDALAMLGSLEGTESVEQLNQLRALCFLALGRTRDAEQAVEQIVMKNPAYQLEKSEVSPKLVTLFHDVRRRSLPGVARSLYARAKTSYDAKRWADAERDFKALLQLTTDPDMAGQQEGIADLRQLAEGFLKLSESENAAESRRAEEAQRAEDAKRAEEQKRAQAEAAAAAAAQEKPAAPAPTSPANRPAPAAAGSAGSPRPAPPVPAPAGAVAAPRPATPSPASAPVYTALDATVTAPIELRRVMPRWTPLNRTMATMTLNGLLEIVIDETGTVTSATMAKPVTPGYDSMLLTATRTWRYMPAVKDGKPVRYRQVLEIVLRPSSPQN